MNLLVHFSQDTLNELTQVIDDQIERIAEIAMEDPEEADIFGLFDSIEDFTGLGFVACQKFLADVSSILRITKHEALKAGPVHSGNSTYAQIINSAANYWKHKEEWRNEEKDTHRQRVIAESFSSVGFSVDSEYPLSGVLTEICSPADARFRNLNMHLEVWARRAAGDVGVDF